MGSGKWLEGCRSQKSKVKTVCSSILKVVSWGDCLFLAKDAKKRRERQVKSESEPACRQTGAMANYGTKDYRTIDFEMYYVVKKKITGFWLNEILYIRTTKNDCNAKNRQSQTRRSNHGR